MDSPRSLQQTLENERKHSLLQQATLIRDWNEGPERSEAAKTLIRESFVAWATGHITQETESMIYTILSFAMPEGDAHDYADQEAAYREQLDRQSCPECGDGACPRDRQA